MPNKNEISFERYLTQMCAVPQEALNAALVFCLYQVQGSCAIKFGISPYGSMHRVIFDPPLDWRQQGDRALKILAKSLGFDESEYDSPGVITNLPGFVDRGIIHPAYKEHKSRDNDIAAFFQLAVYDWALSQLGGPQDKHSSDRSKIIYNMTERRNELI